MAAFLRLPPRDTSQLGDEGRDAQDQRDDVSKLPVCPSRYRSAFAAPGHRFGGRERDCAMPDQGRQAIYSGSDNQIGRAHV